MLRLLSYNHLVTYVLLFALTVVLRLPSFHPNYFQDDEAFYLTSAEKVVDGGAQYEDTWDNKPPILVWFYALFVSIFGSAAIFAIRVFTVLYVFLTAMVLNQFVVDNKLLERFSLLPAFLYVVITATPWYAQELNGELLMNLPIILAVVQVLKVGDNFKENQRYLFIAGVMMGFAFMIKYQSVLVFFGLLSAYFIIVTAKVSESFSLFSGFLLVVFLCISGIYLSGALAAYWDIGVVYNLDYIFAGRNPGEEISVLFNLGQYLKLWGGFFLIGLISLVNFRLSYFKNAIRLRKVEIVLLLWALGTTLSVAIGGGRFYLHYFYIMVPVFAIYTATFFELRMGGLIRSLCVLAILVVPIISFGTFPMAAFPKSFEFMDAYITPNGWVHGLRTQLNEEHPLKKYIEPDRVHNGILVLAYEPTVYAHLDLPCATRYTNFSIAYYKLTAFRNLTGYELISKPETLADTYREFQDQMPEYIVDPLGLFPSLKNGIPVLFSSYKTRQISDGNRSYKLYFR